jgi:Na+-translocating ferredoxin:NAD+ oxidoreductase subunit B
MTLDIYRKLAKTLDSLPNGFPSTESGLELRILEHIFTPAEAELFCDLQLTYESSAEIAGRTGRPLDGLEDKLISMCKRGEIKGLDVRGEKKFRMQPWVIGIYEQQGQRLDPELCALCEKYGTYFTSKMAVLKPHIT